MGTNGTGCAEWERDFDPQTEQPQQPAESWPSPTRLEQALHEASVYGIGATSDTNQRVILEAAKAIAALRTAPQEPIYYRYRTKLHGGDWMVVLPGDLPKDKSGWEIEPLYGASPHPTPDYAGMLKEALDPVLPHAEARALRTRALVKSRPRRPFTHAPAAFTRGIDDTPMPILWLASRDR